MKVVKFVTSVNVFETATVTALLIATAAPNQSLALTAEEKEALIVHAPVATPSAESVFLLGDPTSFVSPHVPLPALTTPHDGIDNDGGWTPVDMCLEGATGSGSAQAPDCQHNDDDSSSIDLSFTFTLYGTPYDKVFINNNGNLSFEQLFSTFTAEGFPVDGYPMVAPFWGDVDTGHPGTEELGHVWWQFLGVNTLAVTWDNVGYYNEHGDKLNTFQVLISDGTNESMGIGNNVCFAYDDMQWTTGDASEGSGGFGGVPATVGVNAGNGIDFFQIGRFDQAGVDYDGPVGNNDGVDYLDGLGTNTGGNAICFNASGLNVPPIPTGFPQNDTVTGQCDSTVNLTVSFLSPEAGQTTTVEITDIDGAQTAGLMITNNPGNTATVNFNWPVGVYGEDVGTYNFILKATDSKGATTQKNFQIDIGCPQVDVTIDIKPGSNPNSINRKNDGVIPVAILGSAIFDVNTVEVSSLLFGQCGTEVASPAHTNLDGHYEDVNLDGFMDLVTHYNTQDTNFLTNSTQGCLFGTLIGGAPFFVGTDSVRIVK